MQLTISKNIAKKNQPSKITFIMTYSYAFNVYVEISLHVDDNQSCYLVRC